jgi:hypothetical protein
VIVSFVFGTLDDTNVNTLLVRADDEGLLVAMVV